MISVALCSMFVFMAPADDKVCKKTEPTLGDMRARIDALDDSLMILLEQRLEVCRQVGEYKKQRKMAVVQSNRFNEILEKRCAQGKECGMDSVFVKRMFELIHDESVRQQNELMKK